MSGPVTRSGRPLRFLLTVLLCWAGGRLAMTLDWPAQLEAAPVSQISAMPGKPDSLPRFLPAMPMRYDVRKDGPSKTMVSVGGMTRALPCPFHAQDKGNAAEIAVLSRPASPDAAPDPAAVVPDIPAAIPTATPILMPGPASADRWRGSAWLLWRANGNGGTLAGAGQLGGSQAGFRIDRDLTPKSGARLAAYARLTAALDRPHAPEAATGIALQPSRKVPVSIAIERRIALGTGARNAFAFMAAGGIGPIDIAQGLKLEGYGQAGMVGLRHRDAFADGRISLLHPLGRSPLSAGVSVSGGAQPHIARLDIGPAIEARLPIGGQPTRLIAEWRERVAGTARPGSGFALTLAADF